MEGPSHEDYSEGDANGNEGGWWKEEGDGKGGDGEYAHEEGDEYANEEGGEYDEFKEGDKEGGEDGASGGTSELDAWEQRDNEKWTNLEEELAHLDESTAPTVCQYLRQEIEKRKMQGANPEFMRQDARSVKLVQKVFVDISRQPDFNYVGKILGPKGANAKAIALEANVKLAVAGRGSMKDGAKEEELIQEGSTEHDHLKDPLHVRVESVAPPMRAWDNIQRAINMVTPLMTPGDDNGLDPYYRVPPRVAYRPRPPLGLPPRPPPPAYAAYPMAGRGYPYGIRASSFGKVRPRGRGRGGRPY